MHYLCKLNVLLLLQILYFVNMFYRIQIIVFFLLLSSYAYCKTGYKIRIEINNTTDSIGYLACYYGDRIISADTSKIIDEALIFQGQDQLPGGIYVLISQNKVKLFEFIIDDDQHFKILTDTTDYVKNIKVSGSKENKLFFDYLTYTAAKHKQIKKAKQKLNNKLPPDSIKYFKEQIKIINREVSDYKIDFIKTHPENIMSLVFSIIRKPELVYNESNKETIDSNQNYKYIYFKNHYWDYVNFSDPRLIRTPVFHNKLNQYFEHIVFQQPDSICKEIDTIIYKANNSPELINYLFWYFMEKYDDNKFMGYDEIFVHLVEKYADKDKLDISESVRSSIMQRAKQIKPLLIGKKAPNLILLDTNNHFVSFHSIKNDFIITLFWDFDCDICKEDIKFLKDLYDTTKIDFEIFAVCTDTNLVKWKKFIRKNNLNWFNVNGTRSITRDFHELYDIYGTPVLYILNRKREIIAKRISVENVYPFLSHYVQRRGKEK